MKKILYILFCLVPLLTMQSCTEHLEENLTNERKLSTTISVIVPQLPNAHPQTRAMGILPDVNSLHVAVFDENGYLLEYVKAQVKDQYNNDVESVKQNNVEYKYTVDLTPTDFKTTLHFIGNGPTSIRFGTETEVMSKLYTKDGQEAYWQRVVLEEGVKFVEKNDNELVLDSDVAAALTGVELIRNFAWINLTESADNFSIISYCVVNTYDKGSVAPYNSAKFGFATFGNANSYDNIVKEQSYNGFIPADADLDKKIPKEATWFKVNDNNKDNKDNYAYYIYEREKATSDHPYILVKGQYTGNEGPSYYKVDLRDDDGSFPIIRNFRYTINIEKVEHAGHITIEEAVNSAGSGDVSTSSDTEKFTNISDNEARIFVSDTEITVTEQTNDLEVLFKFLIYDTSGTGKLSNSSVIATVDTKGDNVIKSSNIVGTQGDEWYKVVISTNTPVEGFPMSQDIIIKGTYKGANNEDKSLQRKVTINLRTKYNMQLICDPAEITREMGTPFDVLIKLPNPANMNQSVFPLEFQLEAENQSMTPNLGDDLPAITGKSIVPQNTGKTTIGFVRHLEYSTYLELATDANGNKILPCHFKSNKNIGETVEETKIYSQNKYFNSVSTDLKYYNSFKFDNLAFNPAILPTTKDTNVGFSFDIPEAGLELLDSRSGDEQCIIVTLENLTKADDRLEYFGAADGKSFWKFNPTQTSETLRLKTTTDNATIASVSLSAYHFKDASTLLIPSTITIPAGLIMLGSKPSTYVSNSTLYDFSIYPSSSSTTTIGTFRTSWNNGSNQSPFKLNFTDANQIQTIIDNNWTIYIKFTYYRTTYVATANLQTLLNGDTVELDWQN